MSFNPFNIDTETARVAYWKSFDRYRGEHYEYARRRYLKALADGYRSWVVRFDTVTTPAEMTQYEIDPEPMERAYSDVYRKVGADFAVRTFRSIKSGGHYLTKDYTVNDYRDMMTQWLGTVGATRITSVNVTTNKQILGVLQRILLDAQTDGLSIPQVRRLVTAEFQQLAGYRAERIARTEIVAASNHGALMAAESTNLELNKVWIATRDDRTRDDHAEADGQTVMLKESFRVGVDTLDMPGDPNAPASNVINCRCSVAFSRPVSFNRE